MPSVLIAAVIIGVTLGIFSPAWVLLAITFAFAAILYVLYVLGISKRSLFGKLDSQPEKRAEEISFRIFVFVCSFLLPMWFSYLFR